MKTPSALKRYGYLWITLAFFVFSLVGHWFFSWMHYINEQEDHGQSVAVSEFIEKTLAETFENWQSEFLQLLWQVGGLAVLLYVGSPQSKEGDERVEEKVDFLVKNVAGEKGETFLRETDRKFVRK